MATKRPHTPSANAAAPHRILTNKESASLKALSRRKSRAAAARSGRLIEITLDSAFSRKEQKIAAKAIIDALSSQMTDVEYAVAVRIPPGQIVDEYAKL